MTSKEELLKIKEILEISIENFNKNQPFPEDVLTSSSMDVINQISEIDQFIASLILQIRDLVWHELEASSWEDTDYDKEKNMNEATMEWLTSNLANITAFLEYIKQ